MCVLTHCARSHLLSRILKPSHVGIIAWIVGVSEQGHPLLRDASGLREMPLQGSKSKDILRLPGETLLCMEGYYDGLSLHVEDYEVCLKPSKPPISYLELPGSLEELARHSPWYMRHPRWSKTLLVQHLFLRYAREYLYGEGFIELLPPMVSVVSDPGLRGARKLETRLYGRIYELTSSVIMYKQAGIGVFEKVFFVARNIREEPEENISTGRHLAEFTQLDVEAMLLSAEEAMSLAEKTLHYASKKLLDEHQDLVLGLNPGFRELKPPFQKISYEEALSLAKRLGYDVEWGMELSHEAETAVAEHFDTPVWITGFPVTSRGFYYKPDPYDPRYNRDFNLILPKGYGEVIDGGEREYRADKLAERIKALGENPARYKWLLELAEGGGIPPSAGWGLGVERMTRFITGARHIALAASFPKLPGIINTP